MELDEFIKASLTQIIAGVQNAQAEELGENINAEFGHRDDVGGQLIHSGAFGMVTRVDFDVAVSAELDGGGKANLKVFGVGVEGGGGTKHSNMNRVAFSVPVRLPDGDKTRAQEVRAKRAEDAEAAEQRAKDEIAKLAQINAGKY